MKAVNTGTIPSSITSFGSIAFSNTPNIPTAISSDNSTKIANVEYALTTVNDPVNFTGLYQSFGTVADIILNTVKTFLGSINTPVVSNDTSNLTLGDATTTSITLGGTSTSLSLLGQLQAFDSNWKYCIFGSAGNVNKMQSGIKAWTSGSNGLTFPVAFVNVPSIVVSGGSSAPTASYSVQGLNAGGCNIRSNSTTSNNVYWWAVGS